MSSVTVPPRGATPNTRHFLLCDAMNDYWQKFSTDSAKSTLFQSRVRAEDELSAVEAVEHFFPISEHVASSLRAHYGAAAHKITVVGTGRGKIVPLRNHKDYTRKNILVVAAQRLEDKGVPLLLEALQIARQTDPQLHLTLVAPDAHRGLVQDAEGVTFTGRVEWSALQTLFEEACLYAMPALCEPWGLVYAEALATKTPLLGLDRGAFPELSGRGNYGFVVPDATPEAVAQTLLEAVSDPGRLQAMGEAGQKFCLEAFTWERTAKRIIGAIWPTVEA